MAILNNLDNEYPLFESESSGQMKFFSDSCLDGCTCQTSSDHNKSTTQ